MSSPHTASSSDLIDRLLQWPADHPAQAVRHQRDKVVAATQGSYDGLFDPQLSGLSLVERGLAAWVVASLSGSEVLSAHYRAQLLQGPALSAEARAVLDGRDIGTVIAPDAPAKLFITATPEASPYWSRLS